MLSEPSNFPAALGQFKHETGEPKNDARREADELWDRFRTAITCYPADWSVESRRPSEDVWTFGRAQVRYRIVPDAEAVEILSIRRIESD